jgi:hypothetical protein
MSGKISISSLVATGIDATFSRISNIISSIIETDLIAIRTSGAISCADRASLVGNNDTFNRTSKFGNVVKDTLLFSKGKLKSSNYVNNSFFGSEIYNVPISLSTGYFNLPNDSEMHLVQSIKYKVVVPKCDIVFTFRNGEKHTHFNAFGNPTFSLANTFITLKETNTDIKWETYVNGVLTAGCLFGETADKPSFKVGITEISEFDNIALGSDIQDINANLDLKVDKVDGMDLSHNDFTDAYKIKVENMQNHFKGVFTSVADINAQVNCVRGDYCVLKGMTPNPDYVYFYNGTVWVNSNASLGGDMLSSIYDETGKKLNVYNRSNHEGIQPINTIKNLQEELDKKLNVVDKTKVVDNFESDSPTDALSANCGGYLRDKFIDITIGKEPIEYGSLKEENGYTTLSNGMILQWGTKDLGSSTAVVEVTYPIPYPNRCLNISVTPKSNTYSGSGSNSCYGQVIDNTKFHAVMDYKNLSVTTSCYWFAIGF